MKAPEPAPLINPKALQVIFLYYAIYTLFVNVVTYSHGFQIKISFLIILIQQQHLNWFYVIPFHA